ncbi:MAG: DUF5615 family PIN-like protein [Zestosphaera sp.]
MSSRRLKLLLDESIGLKPYRELKERGYDVQSVIAENRGALDEDVIKHSMQHNKIIVTMDKDFGYLAQAYNPPGIVLLRLREPLIPRRLEAILRALSLGEDLYGYIVIVTETRIRRRQIRVTK